VLVAPLYGNCGETRRRTAEDEDKLARCRRAHVGALLLVACGPKAGFSWSQGGLPARRHQTTPRHLRYATVSLSAAPSASSSSTSCTLCPLLRPPRPRLRLPHRPRPPRDRDRGDLAPASYLLPPTTSPSISSSSSLSSLPAFPACRRGPSSSSSSSRPHPLVLLVVLAPSTWRQTCDPLNGARKRPDQRTLVGQNKAERSGAHTHTLKYGQ